MKQKHGGTNRGKVRCHGCGGSELLEVDGEAVCLNEHCSWDSCRSSVNAGDMDFVTKLNADAIMALPVPLAEDTTTKIGKEKSHESLCEKNEINFAKDQCAISSAS